MDRYVAERPRNGDKALLDRPVSSARRVRSASGRRAFCPFCGQVQTDKLLSDVGDPEAALCAGRCAAAWQVLSALRRTESASEPIADRRRVEWETQQPHASTLSELLLGRWRAGDWAVAPEDLLGKV
jgi:hypothetical protein